MKRIDIIIVNYNSTPCLLECIRSLYQALNGDRGVGIYVFDNGSRDNVDLLTGQFPRVVLLKNKGNIGFARAVNHLLSLTDAPYVMLLNPDTRINRSFFDPVVDFFAKNQNVAVVGPRIFEANGNIQGSARSFPTPLTGIFGRSTLLSKLFPNNRITAKNILTNPSVGEKNIKVDWVSGACMVIRRRALEDVGPLDERFFLYWEDADVCRRMMKKGWQVFYCPAASVVHYAGVSSGKRIRPVLEFHKSAYHFFCKHSAAGNVKIIRLMVFFALTLRCYAVMAIQCLSRFKKGESAILQVGKNRPIG